MANTKYITGTISKINENGSGNVLLKMNELEIEKNFNWELDKNTFEFYLDFDQCIRLGCSGRFGCPK